MAWRLESSSKAEYEAQDAVMLRAILNTGHVWRETQDDGTYFKESVGMWASSILEYRTKRYQQKSRQRIGGRDPGAYTWPNAATLGTSACQDTHDDSVMERSLA